MFIPEKLIMLLKFIFLGFVQGFTEPIPVSSSGHVLIFRHLFDIGITGLSFEIIVNFGSLIAIIFFYRSSIQEIILYSVRYLFKKDLNGKNSFHFLIMIFVSTFTTGVIGLFTEDMITKSLSSIHVVGISLFITAFALWMIRHTTGFKEDQNITIKDAFLIGVAQSFALVPGISRSGATIVAALLLGLKKKTALKYSFLLYIPVSLGVTALSVPDIIRNSYIKQSWTLYAIAFLTATLATFYALKWFIQIMANNRLGYFSIYCVVLGVAILIF